MSFILFTNSWRRALQRRQRLIEDGEKDIVIIAIWSKGLHNVYDAYDVARMLGYLDESSKHLDKYLVHRGISADVYRILTIFNGQKEQKNIALGVPGLQGSVTIPSSSMTDVPGRTAKEKLENEIYQHTGVKGDSEQLLYLAGIMIGAFDCPWTSFVVVPKRHGQKLAKKV